MLNELYRDKSNKNKKYDFCTTFLVLVLRHKDRKTRKVHKLLFFISLSFSSRNLHVRFWKRYLNLVGTVGLGRNFF